MSEWKTEPSPQSFLLGNRSSHSHGRTLLRPCSSQKKYQTVILFQSTRYARVTEELQGTLIAGVNIALQLRRYLYLQAPGVEDWSLCRWMVRS